MRNSITVAALTLAGCIYPTDPPTGVEFSWRFVEVEPSDGDEARRIVTCAGTGIETIAADVTDTADTARTGRFRFACDDGFQTAEDVARAPSDAFLELRPSDYEIVLETEAPEAASIALGRRTVEVLGRESTQSLWELELPPVEWTLTLAGTTTCGEYSLGLFYADPEAALTEVPTDGEGEPQPVLYRSELVSDRGLGVAARATECVDLDGDHRFTGLDRGTYRLEVIVDGSACAFEVALDGTTATTVDLAELPCA